MSTPKDAITCDIVREEGGKRVFNTRLEWQVGRNVGDVKKQRWYWECSCGATGRRIDPNRVPWPRVALTRLWQRHVSTAHPDVAS